MFFTLIDENFSFRLESSDQAFFDEESYFPNTYLSDNTTLTQEEEEFLTANLSNDDFYGYEMLLCFIN